MVLPLFDFIGNSAGEDMFWSFCRDHLPEQFVSFHNYFLGLKQVDNIMLVPGKGILVLEIKSYRAQNIIDVPDHQTIRRKNEPPDLSPLRQANGYRYHLIDRFLAPAGINSVYVIPVVCYPFVTEEEYYGKKLDKISPREITILREDISTAQSLLKRIDLIFDYAYDSIHAPELQKNGFFPPLLETVGNLISRDFRNKKTFEEQSGQGEISQPENESRTEQAQEANSQRDYSLLHYSKDGSEFTAETVSQYIRAWLSGTRMQLYTSDAKILSYVRERFEKAIQDREDQFVSERVKDSLRLKNGMSFRLEIGLVRAEGESFQILNGDRVPDDEDRMRWLDAHSDFNYGQYCMEHAPAENIIVKAGAGTGKTFSLISRINYLIWKDVVLPEKLPGYLAMITFTNDSANQMKESLIKNFLQFYYLSGKSTYLDYIEAIEKTQISTIDALARTLISKFAVKLGLGQHFRIVTGTYERTQLMRQALNRFLETNPDATSEIPMTMFHFEQRLLQMMEKLDNKNVDLGKDFDTLQVAGGDKQLPPGILKALMEVQRQQNEQSLKNNTICLGDLIRKLRQLADMLYPEDLADVAGIKYLFIDEFQDTDDVQIELIHRFQSLIGFRYFVVGDTKQCIYRFRGAEVKAFDTLKRMDRHSPVCELALRKNYRTDSGLLELMNGMFSAWNEDGDLEYQGDDVLTGTKAYTATPVFRVVEGDLKGNENTLVNTVRSAQKEVARGDGRVAILVRYNAQIRTVQEICERHGIRVSTDVGGELFSSDPVIDLYKLLMAFRYNKSPEYLYNLYTTSFVKQELPKTCIYGHEKQDLVQMFYEHPPIEGWQKYLDELRTEPILKVLQSLILFVKPWDLFAEKSTEDPNEQKRNRRYYSRNLDQLFENLIHIANTDYLTLNKLSDYLELMILTRQEADAREPFGADAADGSVICTTVHKAKGAEYDAVILPFCNFDISCSRDRGLTDIIYSDHQLGYRILDQEKRVAFENEIYCDFQKDEALSRRHEEVRILYVALTRAKRAVYCIARQSGASHSESWADKIKEGR